MCGIFACVGYDGDVVDTVLPGLRSLEYRGYDSAGIGVAARSDPRIERVRVPGSVEALAGMLSTKPLAAPLAVGHTRWATHGAATRENAHPHVDCSGRIGLVHNGVVENFRSLRTTLLADGHRLTSATDTELLVHLVESQLAGTDPADLESLTRAVRSALEVVDGAHACVFFVANLAGLVCARRGSAGGLRIAFEGERAFVASDGAALSPFTDSACFVPPDTVAAVTPDGLAMFGLGGTAVPVQWTSLPPATPSHPVRAHFPGLSGSTAFFREVVEQPAVLATRARAISQVLDSGHSIGSIRNGGLLADALSTNAAQTVRLLACGTPLYACMVGRDYIQGLAGVAAHVEPAHEFAHNPYSRAFGADLTLVVSQSGETADSLLALEKARAAGSLCVAVTNTVDSSLDLAADVSFYTQCGPEYSVAQTKAFTGAIATLLLVACIVARQKGRLTAMLERSLARELGSLELLAARAIALSKGTLEPVVHKLSQQPSCLFLGRGLNYPVALEGALKLKELSYLHAEGYAAGELKHGPIALICPGFPVLAIICRDQSRAKMLSQVAEVTARGADLIVVAEEGDQEAQEAALLTIPVPSGSTTGLLAPAITAIPLQILAGLVANRLGRDVDRPRNLAKSVTVI